MAVSPFSLILFHGGEKHRAGCTGLYLARCQSDEISPSPHPASSRAPGRTGTSLRAGGGGGSLVSIVHSHNGLSDRNAKKRLPTGRGQRGRHTLAEPDLQ